MSLSLPPELGLDESEIESLFARFRIPVEEAQELLHQTLLTLVLRHPDLRSPQLWVMSTLKRRCVFWWRTQRRRVNRAFDIGIRSALTATEKPDKEIEAFRASLWRWTASLEPRCRELLRRRYGLLEDEVVPVPEIEGKGRSDLDLLEELTILGHEDRGTPESPSDEVLRCLSALMRRAWVEWDSEEG